MPDNLLAEWAKSLEMLDELARHILENNCPLAIWVKVFQNGADRPGIMRYINHRYEDIFAVSRHQYIGWPDMAVWPSEIAEEFLLNDHHVLETGQVIETIENTKRLGGKWDQSRVWKYPATWQGFPVVAGICCEHRPESTAIGRPSDG